MDNNIEERSGFESLMDYVQLFWHWAWLLLLVGVLSGLAGYYFSNQQTRIYQSSTLAMVSGASGSSVDSYSSILTGQQLAATYINTMVTGPILDQVSEKLGYKVLAREINVTSVSGTSLIKITVTNTDPQKAADIANALVTVFADQIVADQTSRYRELKTNLETEIAKTDKLISDTQETIIKISTELNALTNLATPQAFSTPNPTDAAQTEKMSSISLQVAQYQNTLSQYQQSRAYNVQSYQQVKLAEAQSVSSLVQKDPAVVNKTPISPRPVRTGLMVALVGLMVAAGIIFLIDFINDTVRDPEEITRKWGIPVIGVIVNYNSAPNTLITVTHPRSPISESFRSIRTNIQFSGVNKPLQTILITSASPEDGKTSFVANFANVMAQNDRNVVVIDADLRRPRIHKAFQLTNRMGLSDYFIRSQDQLVGVVKPTETKKLSVITSGSLPPNPSELLGSEKMMEVLTILGKHCDSIIIDSPPLLAVTDALVLAPKMDGVILVTDPRKTKRAALKHSIDQLRSVNANILGVVLNNVKVKQSPYYYNRKYYYGKQYGKYAEDQIDAE